MSREPYKTTPEFDEASLPDAIRNRHSTKQGVWGLLRVIEGEVTLVFEDPPRRVRVTPEAPAEIAPEARHHVETGGQMRMIVEFHREPPLGD